MSVFSTITSKKYGYEAAFGACDCSSAEMQEAISEWFDLFYRREKTKDADPCQRIPYTVVNKIAKTAFAEYSVKSENDFAAMVLQGLGSISVRSMHDALIGGLAYIKPFPLGDRFVFSSVSRNNLLVFGKDVEGNPTDVGSAERTIVGNVYYTLLERRTIGGDGLLTIKNRLYRSNSGDTLGRPIPLASVPRYAELPVAYTYQEPIGLGMVPLRCPVPNCVDGSTDPVSVFAAAVGLIHNIDRNEAELSGEFERGQSRLIVSSDLLEREEDTSTGRVRKRLKDNVFVGIEDDPINAGITIFSPALREQSFLARKTEYLRNVESLIGLKRGLLSDVESAERTATEVTSSAGDYNLTIIDFQRMWGDAVRQALVLCGKLGRLYRVHGAVDLKETDAVIDWGNGVLYDENKTWTDYKAMVAAGLLRPEIAVGWYFSVPTETPADLQKIREKYMPVLESMMDV